MGLCLLAGPWLAAAARPLPERKPPARPARRPWPAHPGAGGFTLVECAVALAVLGLALGTLLPATMEALGHQARAARERGAIIEAEQLLARVGRDIPLAEARWEGRSGAYAWDLAIAPAEVAANPWVTGWSVVVSVAAPGWPQRPVTLSTLRLAPGP